VDDTPVDIVDSMHVTVNSQNGLFPFMSVTRIQPGKVTPCGFMVSVTAAELDTIIDLDELDEGFSCKTEEQLEREDMMLRQELMAAVGA
jgi:hypothetical protein